MLNYERVNQLSGICLDEQIPLAWVDNHVLISQDMSMAVGLKIEYPDTLFVSSAQIDELHNEFTSMLNQHECLRPVALLCTRTQPWSRRN